MPFLEHSELFSINFAGAKNEVLVLTQCVNLGEHPFSYC